ncbi:MAG TPA: hypothetical protein VIJ19_07930, partial [Opitutaceae bacterium]
MTPHAGTLTGGERLPMAAAKPAQGSGRGSRLLRAASGSAKSFAWTLCGFAVGFGRLGAAALGRRRRVDVLI